MFIKGRPRPCFKLALTVLLIVPLLVAQPSAADELTYALKKADWTRLDVFYGWKDICSDVVTSSQAHARFRDLAADSGITLRRLGDRPSPDKKTPTLLVGCTGKFVGDSRILGVHTHLMRRVSYRVGDTVFTARMNGHYEANMLRLYTGFRGAERLMSSTLLDLFGKFIEIYSEVNRAAMPEAEPLTGERVASETGLEVADWRRLPVNGLDSCPLLDDLWPITADVAKRLGLEFATTDEVPTKTIPELVSSQPQIVLACNYRPSDENADEFYRFDATLARHVVYDDGETLRHGMALSWPKLIVGGIENDFAEMMYGDRKLKATFEVLWEAFLKQVAEANQ